MRLGPLQKYIFTLCPGRKHVSRHIFLGYYKGMAEAPSFEDRVNAITKTLEKMISRDLMTAEGVKTADKFFIRTIKLTPRGAREAKKLRGEQPPLPLIRKK
jgi:hypothetical protein